MHADGDVPSRPRLQVLHGARFDSRRGSGYSTDGAAGLVSVGRVLAFAVAAVLELSGRELSGARMVLLAAVGAHAILRVAWRRPHGAASWVDALAAAALVATTGGPASPWAVYAEVTLLGSGFGLGPVGGMLAGVLVGAASAPAALGHFGARAGSPLEAATWFVLFPLIGMAGGMAARIWRAGIPDGERAVADANRVLADLYRLARTMPVGLEAGTVAQDALVAVRERLRAPAGVFLTTDDGVVGVEAAFGISASDRVATASVARLATSGPSFLDVAELGPLAAMALAPHRCWSSAPVRRGGETLGVLLVACPDHSRHDRVLDGVRAVAEDASTGMQNAVLFRRLRELSVDEERTRIAGELHDGVAQALTHLRFELEAMSRDGITDPIAVRAEVARLAGVAERALGDVRSTVHGLRSSLAGGLSHALSAYAAELRGGGGPEIDFETSGEVWLDPAAEAEVFRIGQEALSNALRHAGARRVRVALTATAAEVHLTVEDDGRGMPKTARPESVAGGVGLAGMRERAEHIGARLAITHAATGGTRVALVCAAAGGGVR